MSRIGKLPVVIPSGIDVKLDGNSVVFTKGKTEKVLDTRGHVNVNIEDNVLVFSPKSEERQDKAFWGTYRSLASNVITGLTDGFTKKLEINGVGYKAAVNGNVLELQLGFSHPIKYDFPQDVQIAVEKNVVTITGQDKQVIGKLPREIRGFRPPEPYKGKGVKYVGERIIRKAGKTSKK